MYRYLVTLSASLGTTGLAGTLLLPFPSRLFVLSAHALTVACVTAVLAWAVSRRGAVDEAFDLGVTVGERRARRARNGPVVVDIDAARRARETAGA